MNADRNLLFGLLALQLDFIDRDALIEGMNAWLLEKSKSIGDVLTRRGNLSADRRQLLEALVGEHLAAHDNDPQLSLATVHVRGPLRAALEEFQDADMDASLAHLPDGSGDAWVSATISLVGEPTSIGSRFRILRRHASGGLGEVSIAVDNELHREVALKEIQERYADQQEIRDRFVREAEITGGLEHPGIVPVYGLGHYDDGRPYYAMRFVKGDSLKRAIKRFHEDSHRSDADRNFQLRKLLRRLLDVCNAMHYAHNRGVLHRDLKPGNIMVGKYGETLVVDWGLATCQAVDRGETTEMPLPSPSTSGSTATLAGSVIGTPAYMSPEQATGRLDELGPRSDVYSLGATLYTLLTGKPPVVGEVAEMLEAVREGNFPSPRQLDRRVPAALNAICLKAMATRSADRYASCAELAEEIDAWLADAPVLAHRNLFYRGRLWVKRHRTAVVAGGLIVVALLSCLGVVARRSARLNHEIQQHIRQAEFLVPANNLDRSEAELAVAAALCSDPFVSPRWRPQIERRREQLERFKSFLQHSRAARFYTSESISNFSEVTDRRGTDTFADLCRKSLAVYSVLEDDQWETTWLEPELLSSQQAARVREEVGELLVYLALRHTVDFSDTDQARARTKEALGYLVRAEEYIQTGPGICTLRMLWLRRLGDNQQADEAGKKATQLAQEPSLEAHTIDSYILAQCTQHVLKNPQDAIPMYLRLLNQRANHFRTHFALADCYYETGDLEGQRRHMEVCLALAPDNATLNYIRGMNSFMKGDYRLAFDDFDASVKKDADFAIGYFYRGRMRVVFENWSAAVADFSQAIALDPEFDSAYDWRAIGHAKIGKHADAAGDAEKAITLSPESRLTHYYASRALAQAVASVRIAEPDATRAKELAEQYGQRSLEILKRGVELGFDDFTRLAPGSDFDPVRSLPRFREVLRPAMLAAADHIARKLQQDESADPKQQLALGELYLSLGELESDAAEPDAEALGHFDQGARVFQALMRDTQHRRSAAGLLLRTLERKAKLLDRLDRSGEADPVWQQLALLQGSTQGAMIDRAYALAQSGKHVDAAAKLEQLLDQHEDLSGNNFYNLACAFSVIAGAVQADDRLTAELHKQRTSALTRQVVEMLQKAAAMGFFKTEANVAHLKTDDDFDTVRQSEEFREFAENLGTEIVESP